MDPKDGDAMFRLGVCHRMRHESPGRKDGDDKKSVDLWRRAHLLDKRQYIWRRRIEQYGPRGQRPYVFYDWMIQAISEITNRGDKLPPLGRSWRSAASQPSEKPTTQPKKRKR